MGNSPASADGAAADGTAARPWYVGGLAGANGKGAGGGNGDDDDDDDAAAGVGAAWPFASAARRPTSSGRPSLPDCAGSDFIGSAGRAR
jgi:hypothetical protein